VQVSVPNAATEAARASSPAVNDLVSYFARLTGARAVLWCYLLWYVVVVTRYFEPNARLWLTSGGLSLIIGFALLLNARSGDGRISLNGWQRFRFFLAPFCVSSFSALVKGKGFVLVFSPNWRDLAVGVAACAGFLALVGLARRVRTR
jgi:hypothetical protein